MSPITWNSEFLPFAEKEGSGLFFAGDEVTMVRNPEERLSASSWAELASFNRGPSFGYLSYEMGSPLFPWELPLALFYKPAIVKKMPRRAISSFLPIDLQLTALSDTRSGYYRKIEMIQEMIAAGEVYQVNLTQKFTFQTALPPFELFQRIYARNPASYAAYLHCGDFVLLSFSPELFVEKRGGKLRSSPIKGTKARGKDAQVDKKNLQALCSSSKERAELLMITDLMRNDFSRISSEVETTELFVSTAHPTLFHLHSTVEAMAPPLPPLEVVRTLFPAGSITGCPKIRAMEVIADLEKRARGVYTGAIGMIEAGGDFTFNVAIRTLLYRKGIVEAGFGGGIVYDSLPEEEYEELFHKANFCFPLRDTFYT